jgi:signal transduction histidine kinase
MILTVFRNLVSNGIKFSYPDSEIIISAKENADTVEISVTDYGVGIHTSDIDKLFRIDVSHSTIGTGHEKGTGLGLILCREFVERHGGRIWVESEISKGSSFKFELPRNLEAAETL